MIQIGSPQFLFMAEVEGFDKVVTTRQAKLNAIVNDIHEYPQFYIDFEELKRIAETHGIAQLTDSDIDFIQNRI